MSTRLVYRTQTEEDKIVIGVALRFAEHLWEVRGYETELNGNQPVPLSDEPFAVFYKINSL